MFIPTKTKKNIEANFLSEPKVSKVLKFVKRKNKLTKWLDLGCGNGEFLLAAKKKRY